MEEKTLADGAPGEDGDYLNIVIVGASFAGLAVAHKFLRNIIHQIGKTRSPPRYRVILVGPSTCLYWNIGAPRALVSNDLLPLDHVFVPFLDLFDEYPRTQFQFIQGWARSIDFHHRRVSIEEVADTPAKTGPGTSVNTRFSDPPTAADRTETTSMAWSDMVLRTIDFHALVLATGTTAISPLLSLRGPHENTIRSLTLNHEKLKRAETVVVIGGGCSGVEIAGQLATWLNRGKARKQHLYDEVKQPRGRRLASALARTNLPPAAWSWLPCLPAPGSSSSSQAAAHSSQARPPFNWETDAKQIYLLHAHERLLPRLDPKYGLAAERKLRTLGVYVQGNTRVDKISDLSSGDVRISYRRLDHPQTEIPEIKVDVAVKAMGVLPNTAYLPAELLDASGFVNTEPRTLRVLNAGPRVYAVGDCASHTKNSIQDVYDSLPTALHNLQNDLIEHEVYVQYPHGGGEERLQRLGLEDWEFDQSKTDSQLMPITAYGGVGILFGNRLPSFLVWLMKGRDYRIGRAKQAAGVGKDPYAVV